MTFRRLPWTVSVLKLSVGHNTVNLIKVYESKSNSTQISVSSIIF